MASVAAQLMVGGVIVHLPATTEPAGGSGGGVGVGETVELAWRRNLVTAGRDDMPSTVQELLNSADLKLAGRVRWSESVPSRSQGVYLVSLSDSPDVNNGILDSAPISLEKVRAWIDQVSTIRLDGVTRPTSEALASRLAGFWLPDESVLYIGMTTRPLSERVGAYYRTALGKRSPHAGGLWIKTLSNLDQLYVYYADCSDPEGKEEKLIGTFVDNVSTATRSRLLDPAHPFPFANLEYPQRIRKQHGIGGSKLG